MWSLSQGGKVASSAGSLRRQLIATVNQLITPFCQWLRRSQWEEGGGGDEEDIEEVEKKKEEEEKKRGNEEGKKWEAEL